MNLTDIRLEKKQILADIKALRLRYDKLVKRECEMKRQRIKSGHCCTYKGCYNLTSRKTSIARLGEHYKWCDACRLRQKLKRI
jgi:hypothetical protein